MSLLTPKMTELREKYKDDPQKMNEEVMKLYREYGVNPFSGCVPMLIQIPIFFGFYAMLGSAIELRNSSFLWVHDLSQPDTVFQALGISDQRSPHRDGRDDDLADGNLAEKRRRDATADLLLHAGCFSRLLLQLCKRTCALLGNAESFLYRPTLPDAE